MNLIILIHKLLNKGHFRTECVLMVLFAKDFMILIRL